MACRFTLSSPLSSPVCQVVTPSGFSYERAAIERYLTSSKAEDPQSRAPLTPAALVPNLGLKAAAECFLAAHPWAHPYVGPPAEGATPLQVPLQPPAQEQGQG